MVIIQSVVSTCITVISHIRSLDSHWSVLASQWSAIHGHCTVSGQYLLHSGQYSLHSGQPYMVIMQSVVSTRLTVVSHTRLFYSQCSVLAYSGQPYTLTIIVSGKYSFHSGQPYTVFVLQSVVSTRYTVVSLTRSLYSQWSVLTSQ